MNLIILQNKYIYMCRNTHPIGFPLVNLIVIIKLFVTEKTTKYIH